MERIDARARMSDRIPLTQFRHTEYSIADFVGWQRDGSLVLNPDFQRRNVWPSGAKSYLIDTIVRGYSIPIVFLRDQPADIRTLRAKRDVVDGQQRLRTILAYVDPGLLKDFDKDRDDFRIDAAHNEELGGKSFAQLSRAYKQRILDYQFSVHIFPADTDDRQILQIFARMNATGMKLNAQELRNAEFFGRFKTLAYELAHEQLNRWRTWRIFTPDQIARMDEVALTSEFMLLIMEGIMERDNATISAFYADFDQEFPDERQVANRYRLTMDGIEQLITGDTVAELFSNRTLFYALFSIMYGSLYELRVPRVARKPERGAVLRLHTRLRREAPKSISQSLLDHVNDKATNIKQGDVPEDIVKATRGSTAHATSRRTLIHYLAGDDDDPCPPLP